MGSRKFTYGGRTIRKVENRNEPKSDKFRLSVAMLVRSIEFQGATGGNCYPRAVIGSMILERFGIQHKIVLGSMLYRTGLAAYDLIGFCGEDNRGYHPGKFHCWIESGEELIDFSCGDWRKITTEIPAENALNLPPINWTFPPPEFIWRKREPFLRAWKPAPDGPSVGTAWYGPIAECNHEMLELARLELTPHLEAAVDAVWLKAGLPVVRIVERESLKIIG